jgi:hypothetical protein
MSDGKCSIWPRRPAETTLRGYICTGGSQDPRSATLLEAHRTGTQLPVGAVAGRRTKLLRVYEAAQVAYLEADLPLPGMLFEIEGSGRPGARGEQVLRGEVAVSARRPLHLVFGTRGAQVVALLEAVRRLDDAQLQRWQDFDCEVEQAAQAYGRLRVRPETDSVTDYLRLHTAVLDAIDAIDSTRSPRTMDVHVAWSALSALLSQKTYEVSPRSWTRNLPVVSDLTSVLVANVPERVCQEVYDFWGLRLAAIRESATTACSEQDCL